MSQFRVIGAVAVVRGENKSERYLYRDTVFEDDGLDKSNLKHLLTVGLIEKVKGGKTSEGSSQSGEKVELPDTGWNNDRIIAWAGGLDPAVTFNPDDKLTKAQMLEALAPQIESAKAAAEQAE